MEELFEKFDRNKAPFVLNENEKALINIIAGGFAEKRFKNELKYPNDVTLKIYISNKLFDKVNDQRETEESMFHPLSKYRLLPSALPKFLQNNASYIKHILETYSRQSLYKRHCTIYKNLFEEINNIEYTFYKDGVPEGVNVFLYDTTFEYLDSGKVRTLIKPYRVTHATETDVPCLLCASSQVNADGKKVYSYDCIPLSNIDIFKKAAKYLGSGKLTLLQKNELDKEAARGFWDMDILVSFSREGLKRYIRDTNKKPYADIKSARISSDGSILVPIKGNIQLLSTYFLEYCSDAVILYPKELKNDSEEMHRYAYLAHHIYSIPDKDLSCDTNVTATVLHYIDLIKDKKISWEDAKDEFHGLNDNPQNGGIYPYFIKTAAEEGITEAFAEYADLLFEGFTINKDYNLAGRYYEKARDRLTMAQKFNLASIYSNELCKGHTAQEGKEIMINRNKQTEPAF